MAPQNDPTAAPQSVPKTDFKKAETTLFRGRGRWCPGNAPLMGVYSLQDRTAGRLYTANREPKVWINRMIPAQAARELDRR